MNKWKHVLNKYINKWMYGQLIRPLSHWPTRRQVVQMCVACVIYEFVRKRRINFDAIICSFFLCYFIPISYVLMKIKISITKKDELWDLLVDLRKCMEKWFLLHSIQSDSFLIFNQKISLQNWEWNPLYK